MISPDLTPRHRYEQVVYPPGGSLLCLGPARRPPDARWAQHSQDSAASLGVFGNNTLASASVDSSGSWLRDAELNIDSSWAIM